MNRVRDIQIINEFSINSGLTYGIYSLMFKDERKVFIKNGDSIGVISHLLGEPASKCVNEIREDVKQEFLECLNLMRA